MAVKSPKLSESSAERPSVPVRALPMLPPVFDKGNGYISASLDHTDTVAAPRPLGSITNHAGTDAKHLPRASTLKRIAACTDLRAEPQSVEPRPAFSGCLGATSATPGSLGWYSDKMKVMDEARAWSTRIKIESTERRLSLPLPAPAPSLTSLTSATRRESAPAHLESARRRIEERLQKAVSSGNNAFPISREPRFTIGGDDDGYLEEDTWTAYSPEADITAVDSRAESELPYLDSEAIPSYETFSSSRSADTLTETIDALEAIFSTSKWQSLLDLEGAATRKESGLRLATGPDVEV
ncbi:hypothetical protein B0H15DRAFT_848344 [Mycena belliarum]|uniref:Uncharacterized protein n=1 Tax=Mycena belliarum TaxID=1033014 RepID=A0AAD6U131_9AGAR|nr:hypothetical protein B0H15DRAFT_848344 [Mycena belliae]